MFLQYEIFQYSNADCLSLYSNLPLDSMVFIIKLITLVVLAPEGCGLTACVHSAARGCVTTFHVSSPACLAPLGGELWEPVPSFRALPFPPGRGLPATWNTCSGVPLAPSRVPPRSRSAPPTAPAERCDADALLEGRTRPGTCMSSGAAAGHGGERSRVGARVAGPPGLGCTP